MGCMSATPPALPPYDAIVLAGGTSRRMGGGDKTALVVGGVPLLDRVLEATAAADARIVAGSQRSTALPVTWAREDPPGGGPAAALFAALPFVRNDFVVLLAGDLPFILERDVTALLAAVVASGSDGVVAADATGAPQWLCSAWRVAALRRMLRAGAGDGAGDGADGGAGGGARGGAGGGAGSGAGGGAHPNALGLPLRKLFASATYDIIDLGDRDAPAWFDCDTPEDLARAKEHG